MHPSAVPEVVAQLNQRETSAYTTREVDFYPREAKVAPLSVLVYIGTETSSGFLGPALIEDIAKQIVQCCGKSGTNSEYVLKLASTMREIAPGVRDTHLFTLEEKVLDLLHSGSTQQGDGDLVDQPKETGGSLVDQSTAS